MSEVTKLYENAGIEPKKCSECDNNMDCGFGKDCYPPFTAEKQLELVKLCFEKYRLLGKTRVTGERCVIYNLRFPDDYPDYTDCATWEEVIAGLINKLWQSLTEDEHRQIKEILE